MGALSKDQRKLLRQIRDLTVEQLYWADLGSLASEELHRKQLGTIIGPRMHTDIKAAQADEIQAQFLQIWKSSNARAKYIAKKITNRLKRARALNIPESEIEKVIRKPPLLVLTKKGQSRVIKDGIERYHPKSMKKVGINVLRAQIREPVSGEVLRRKLLNLISSESATSRDADRLWRNASKIGQSSGRKLPIKRMRTRA
jgi:hypothetical protein